MTLRARKLFEVDMDKNKAFELLGKAIEAREGAYAPYSNFYVGAALLCADGEIITGANVENSSYGGAICAERVAITNAVTHGRRDFEAIAIVGALKGQSPTETCMPCGICRQFMCEFCSSDFKIVLADGENVKIYTMGDLLPHSFDAAALK